MPAPVRPAHLPLLDLVLIDAPANDPVVDLACQLAERGCRLVGEIRSQDTLLFLSSQHVPLALLWPGPNTAAVLEELEIIDNAPAIVLVAPDSPSLAPLLRQNPVRGRIHPAEATLALLAAELHHAYRLDQAEHRIASALATRDQLLTIVSHDLLGPLGTLRNGLSFYLQHFDSRDPAKVRDFLGNAHTSAERMVDLTSRILRWAKTQTGHLRIEPRAVPLRGLATVVFHTLEAQALAKGQRIVIEMAPGLCAWADPDMLETVLRNLIDNAIKFSPTGGTITVRGAQVQGSVHLTVEDNGPGMSPEKQQALLGDNLLAGGIGTVGERGSCLGLPICLAFLEHNHGTLRIESAEGAGSRFIAILPNASAC